MTPYLTSREAVTFLGLPSVRALYSRIERGTIPPWCYGRLGRSYRFDRAALDQLAHPQIAEPVAHGRSVTQPYPRRKSQSVALNAVALRRGA